MNSSRFFFVLLKILVLHKFVTGNLSSSLFQIQYKTNNYKIRELNSFRGGKKLLVLDIDETLYDHQSAGKTKNEFMRPFLHEFLTRAYKDYDIVIWSATNMKSIKKKMKMLGANDNSNYKIVFYLDSSAMISFGEKNNSMVKPLALIWGKYQQFSAKNTIMIDDRRINFKMNPQSGLWIKPYKNAHHLIQNTDRELLKLSDYLAFIALVDDFQNLNHDMWEEFRNENCKHCRTCCIG